MSRNRRSIRPFGLGLLLLVAVAALAQLMATRWGIGLSPDSAQYIAGARSLAHGDGFSFPDGDGTPVPITLWPPMFSALLAIPDFAGIDPMASARWLNLALLIGVVVLSALTVGRMVGKLGLAALTGAALVIASPAVLLVHAWAWSEPTSLFFGLLGLLVLDQYMLAGRSELLIASALATGISLLARFSGAAFVAAGVLGIFASYRCRPGKAGVRDITIFAGVACAPAMLWMIHIFSASGRAAGREFSYGSITSPEMNNLMHQLSLWFVPGRLPASLRVLAVVVIVTVVLVLCAYRMRRYGLAASEGAIQGPWLFFMLASFAVAYMGIVVLARLYIVPRFPLDDIRYWVPLYVAFVLLLVAAVQTALESLDKVLDAARHWQVRTRQLVLGPLVAISVVYFGGLQIYRAIPWIAKSYRSGLGFNSISWHQAELIRFVRELPQGAVLYSNGYDVINVLTERNAFASPLDLHATPSRDENQYNAELAEMRTRLGGPNSYFVYFSGITWRRLATDEVLKQDLSLAPVLLSGEGTAYRLALDGG